MLVLITGHKGFIGRHVYADWQQQLGQECVHGIDIPDDIANFNMFLSMFLTVPHFPRA